MIKLISLLIVLLSFTVNVQAMQMIGFGATSIDIDSVFVMGTYQATDPGP